MGKHKRKRTKQSEACRSASAREYLKNGRLNRKGEEKKS